jgi:peptidoglycan hydrolase CwlO-like protein
MIVIKRKTYFLISVFLLLILIIPVQAESPMTKAKKVKAQISSMKDDLFKAFDAHELGIAKLEKINARLIGNTIKLRKTTVKLKKSQKLLGKRLNSMYRYDSISLLDIIFSANSFNEMLVNLDFVIRVSQKDAQIIASVKVLKRKVASTQKQLVVDRAYQKGLVKKLKKKKDYIASNLSKAKKMLTGLEKEIAELSKPKPLPSAVAEQIIPPDRKSVV